MVKLLINKKHDVMKGSVNNMNISGQSVLAASVNADSIEITRFLLSKYNFNDEVINDALVMTTDDTIELANLLLQNGADPNYRGLINTALRKEDFELVKLLLENGADVPDEEPIAYTIFRLIDRDELEKLKLFTNIFPMSLGATRKNSGNIPNTTLERSVILGRPKITKFLLSNHNFSSELINNAFVLSLKKDDANFEGAKILLDYGADPNSRYSYSDFTLIDTVIKHSIGHFSPYCNLTQIGGPDLNNVIFSSIKKSKLFIRKWRKNFT